MEPDRIWWCIGSVRVKGVSTAAGFCVAILLLLAGTALAKGAVKQITITGPGVDHQIEISDPKILDRFNPWGGLHQFLSKQVDEDSVDPETLVGPYEVRFLLDVHEWVYGFSYYTVEGSEPGYLVLPEPDGDRGFVHPAGWYRNSDAWSEAMSEQLEGVVTPTNEVGRWVLKLFGFLLAIALVGAVVVAVRRKVRANTQRYPARQDFARHP